MNHTKLICFTNHVSPIVWCLVLRHLINPELSCKALKCSPEIPWPALAWKLWRAVASFCLTTVEEFSHLSSSFTFFISFMFQLLRMHFFTCDLRRGSTAASARSIVSIQHSGWRHGGHVTVYRHVNAIPACLVALFHCIDLNSAYTNCQQ